MYKKIFFTSCVCLSMLMSGNQVSASGMCLITGGPIPELAEYSRSIDTKITEIRTRTIAGNCGIVKGGASVGAERTLETLDKAFLEIPIIDNTFIDFQYNVQIAMNGETRAPVTRDGIIFSQVEKKITGAISTAVYSCNLDDALKDEFRDLLIQNHYLETLYKQAALGAPGYPAGLTEPNAKIAEAINAGYNPTATEGCKDQNGIEEGVAKILKGLERIGAKNDNVMVDWKKGIALFRGSSGGKTIEEIINEKRKLLQRALSNIGQSVRFSDRMLSNVDCFERETAGDSSISAAVRAKFNCMRNPILGLERILIPFKKKVTQSITTDERVYHVNNLVKEDSVKKSVVVMDSLLRTRKSPEIESRSALMLDLVDLHISLLFTAEAVEKRLPKMSKNCMKGQVDIACPTP